MFSSKGWHARPASPLARASRAGAMNIRTTTSSRWPTMPHHERPDQGAV
jgi:hypothetical protein